MQSLEDQFLELLKKNEKFRLAVASYLGYEEILRKLREHDEKFNSILEEIKLLRIETRKLWENQNKLWESQEKLWQEVRSLREGQNKLWEEVKSLRENQEKLWENQNKLWENQEKLWQEVKALREGQNKLWEEVKSLREGQNKLWENQNKLWEEVRELRADFRRLDKRLDSLRDSMLHGFGELSKFAGITFEEFTRRFLSRYLRGIGTIPEGAELRREIIDGEEINLFLENPLIVGEVTSYAESSEEVDKLMRKVEIVKNKYKQEPLKYLVVLTTKKEIGREIRKKALENGIELIIGKEV